ncbi:hypothetical protein [Chitinophaga pinensis]|uniref:Uncharacterized protein n=1 Tax=Chitinophaga pinensis TaxID=79329 RepID=A0A5C6LI93_9BACT|nr:hypothetical protein [Chitinophaga pinensis]TWV89100.1 hypothetical protein FEF09_30160 [Chitinophaga pinensis]
MARRFFLLPGRNALGIAAQSDNGLHIADKEFSKVLVGITSFDTPQVFTQLIARFPHEATNAWLHYSIGATLLINRNPEFYSLAFTYFNIAMRQAASQSLPDLVKKAFAKMFLSAQLYVYRAEMWSPKLEIFKQLIQENFPEGVMDPYLICLTRENWAQLGHAASHAKNYEMALFCGVSIAGLAPDDGLGEYLIAGNLLSMRNRRDADRYARLSMEKTAKDLDVQQKQFDALHVQDTQSRCLQMEKVMMAESRMEELKNMLLWIKDNQGPAEDSP